MSTTPSEEPENTSPQHSDSMEELRYKVHKLFGDSQVYEGGYFSSYDGKYLDMTNEVVSVADFVQAYAQQVAREARINTKCPACRMTSLIIGSGGYLVCGNLECSDPGAIDRLAELDKESKT